MGSITQPGGGGDPPIIVTEAPVDVIGDIESFVGLVLPASSEWQVGDIFESEFSLLTSAFDTALNGFNVQVAFTDEVVGNILAPTTLGNVALSVNVRLWGVREAGVGSNIRFVGNLRAEFSTGAGGNIIARQIPVDFEMTAAQADAHSALFSCDTAINFTEQVGLSKITLQN